MRDTLYINGQDAYTTWGITLEQSALSALMTPPPLKAYIENASSARHGKEVLGLGTQSTSPYMPRLDARDLTLVLNMSARDESELMARYASFCTVLAGGILELRTRYQEGVVYRLVYQSCQQFSAHRGGIAKFVLRVTEPNPKRRGQ